MPARSQIAAALVDAVSTLRRLYGDDWLRRALEGNLAADLEAAMWRESGEVFGDGLSTYLKDIRPPQGTAAFDFVDRLANDLFDFFRPCSPLDLSRFFYREIRGARNLLLRLFPRAWCHAQPCPTRGVVGPYAPRGDGGPRARSHGDGHDEQRDNRHAGRDPASMHT